MLDKIERALSGFIKGVGIVSAVIMVLLMVYIAADAVMRNLNRSFVGSNEVVVTIIVAIVFLGMGRTAVMNAHIQIDVFNFWPNMDHVTHWITTAMYVLAGIAAFKQAALAKAMDLSSSFLSIPRWPFLIITGFGLILCGLGAMCVEFRFISAQRRARAEKKAGKEAADQ